jgi:hypothetical protein
MAQLQDTRYLTGDGPDACLYRLLPDGRLQALAVKGRPGFDAARATGGVLYRVEWLDVDAPGAARAAGAAAFHGPDGARAAGACIHLTCPDGAGPGEGQWWCYRPREHDGGTISLLHQWQERPPAPRPRRLRALTRAAA